VLSSRGSTSDGSAQFRESARALPLRLAVPQCSLGRGVMIDRSAIEATLRQSYAARQRGDVEAICALFAEHPHFEMAGASEASPVALRATDQGGFRAALAGLMDAFEFLDYEILSIVIDGSKAAVHWRARVRATATGREAVTELLDIVAFENGKIASFKQFCDTALAAKMMAG
jgi:ketosteroid isomerase-like protein